MTNYNKTNPFPAKLTSRVLLTGAKSTKQTYHLTLDLKGSKIAYEPGDAIGIFPENPPLSVEKLLEAFKRKGDEEIIDPRSQASMSLKHYLLTKVNLSRITLPLLKQFSDLSYLLDEESKGERTHFIENNDLLDLFENYSCSDVSIQELITYFSPLLPRFYSIASSQSILKDSVDLLVVTFSYMQGDKMRQGLGSQFLCERAELLQTPIHIYHHPNATFKLPTDSTVPILMIGPGTGIAPYRAFLQERLEQNATGANWLLFGERNRATDFYYQDFLEDLEKKSFLRLDLAFSRDQEEKIYVQDKLKKHASEVWDWMNGRAAIYICGDAHHMAKDVTAALHDIAKEHGRLSDQEAKEFIRTLRKEKRLLLDVY